MSFKNALVLMTLASTPPQTAASSSSSSSSAVGGGGGGGPSSPRISIQQLQSPGGPTNLHRLLHDSRGVLRVAVGGLGEVAGIGIGGFSDLRKRALGHLCDCPALSPSPTDGGSSATIFEEALRSHPNDLRQIDLPDGTVRRTLATATFGFGDRKQRSSSAEALELPSWVRDGCGRDAYESLEDLRVLVAGVAESFVERLDRENELSASVEGEARSYGQILSGANHLEHFHVYTKPSLPLEDGEDEEVGKEAGTNVAQDEVPGKATPSTLGYHTDAGFFLSFVPAMDCNSYTTDNSSFFLEGQQEPLNFEDDEVVIMMGAGAQYWLPSKQNAGEEGSVPFLAASHALRLPQNTHRSWYGKMHLLPSSLTSGKTAGDVPPSFYSEDYNAYVLTSPVDGCGTAAFREDTLQTQRHLQDHVGSPADCNNSTKFFCWNQCISIPDAGKAKEHVQDGRSLYCLDPARLSDTEDSVKDATAPCAGGYAHMETCEGSWQDTHDEVAGYDLGHDDVEADDTSEDVGTDDEGSDAPADSGDEPSDPPSTEVVGTDKGGTDAPANSEEEASDPSSDPSSATYYERGIANVIGMLVVGAGLHAVLLGTTF